MKKLLVLVAFLGLTYVGVNAQTAAPASPAQQAPKAVSAKPAPVKADAKVEINEVVPVEAKTETKKECSAAEKKSCGSASGKKSCCSSKKAAAAPAKAPVQ